MAERVARRYPRDLWLLAAVVMLLTTLPYLLGYASAGSAWRFTGFVFAVEDGNSYIAKMLRGAAGEWLFRTPYTSYPQGGAVVYLHFLLLGKLSAPPAQHEQLVGLYHLFRLFAGFLYIFASYDFLGLFVRAKRWRLWGATLAAAGGGLGWLLILLGQGGWLGSLPLDLYSPEAFGFLMLYGLPHLAMARALFLWGLVAYLRPERAPWARQPGAWSGALWLLMGFLQPITVVVTWAVIGAHGALMLARRDDWQRWLRRGVLAVAISAPIVLYTVIVFNTDPLLSRWTAQNIILSPHPLHYLVAYGLLLPLAFLGAYALARERGDAAVWLLPGWALVFPLLIYFPYPVQRRLGEGFWLVVLALALTAVERRPRWGRIAPWIFVLTLPTTALLLAGGAQTAAHPSQPAFRPAAEVAAFAWLDEHAASDAVVLAAFSTGNALPAWAPVYVVIGHGPESVNLAALMPRVEAFYRRGTPEAERAALLDEFGVDYVFWGSAERALGDWDPRQEARLRRVYDRDGYAIFAVMGQP